MQKILEALTAGEDLNTEHEAISGPLTALLESIKADHAKEETSLADSIWLRVTGESGPKSNLGQNLPVAA